MRVAYLTGRYPAVSHTFILQEVRALRALGVEVDTFSLWKTDAAELLSQADRDEAAATFNVLPLHPWRTLVGQVAALGGSPAAFVASLRLALGLTVPGLRGRVLGLSWFVEAMTLRRAMARRGITHVHAHLNGSAPAVAMVIAHYGRAAGQPWTWSMTVHGPAEFYDVERERLTEKASAATFVVAISDFARSQLLAHVDAEHHSKIHVVHCGIDLAVFDGGPGADSATEPEDRPLEILCVARLTRIKGHAVLLDAMAEAAARGVPIRATFVGDGPTRPALEARAAELGLEDAVRFTGALGHDKIRDRMAEADVFCLVSFAEGVPVVLMEAMAMRLPVVASRVMGVGELVDSGKSGFLVRPARPDLVADALQQLDASPELRREMGATGRDAVRREFDVHASARHLALLFGKYAAR